MERFPQLKKEKLVGAVVYFDGQFDDARMNVSIILSAIEQGAVALNYVRAEGLTKDHNKINGVLVKNMLNNHTFPVRAHVVINATGPFADEIRKMDNPEAKNIMVPSQGSHILLPKAFSPPADGLIIPSTKDGRVLFLLPWMGKTLAGTTDQMEKITDAPKATNDEVEYILEHLRLYFDVPVKRDDVLASWSGLRPLAKPDQMSKTTASISRDHLIEVSPSQLVTIVGGKWTTYRKMAEDVVNTAISVNSLTPAGESATKNLKLFGARTYKSSLSEDLISKYKLSSDIAEHLAHSYGDKSSVILALAVKNPHLQERLIPEYAFINAEIIYIVHHEYAQHATDIIARRLRLAFLDNKAAIKALPKIIDLMSHELSWDQHRKQAELQRALEFLSTMLTVPPA
jgi:glycerol-3-phosphate dehydrogenase